MRFDYAVASAGPTVDGRALGIATADALTRPLVGVLGATATALTGVTGTVCEVEAPGVEVVMLAPSDDGVAVHLQSYAPAEVGVRLAGREVRVAPGDYVVVPINMGRPRG